VHELALGFGRRCGRDLVLRRKMGLDKGQGEHSQAGLLVPPWAERWEKGGVRS
jgi:hypothetical protein